MSDLWSAALYVNASFRHLASASFVLQLPDQCGFKPCLIPLVVTGRSDAVLVQVYERYQCHEEIGHSTKDAHDIEHLAYHFDGWCCNAELVRCFHSGCNIVMDYGMKGWATHMAECPFRSLDCSLANMKGACIAHQLNTVATWKG